MKSKGRPRHALKLNADGLVAVGEQERRARNMAHRVSAGHLLRLARGHYVPASLWTSLTSAEQLRLKTLAHVSKNSAGTITAAAALALHGSWVKTRGATIRVIGGGQNFPNTEECHRVKENLLAQHICSVNGRNVTTPAKAAFDECRARAGRGTTPVDLRAAALAIEGVLQAGVTREELVAVAQCYPRVHGRHLFNEAMSVCYGFAESPGETIAKVALLECGFSYGHNDCDAGGHSGRAGDRNADGRCTDEQSAYALFEQVEIRTKPDEHGRSAFVARVDFYVPALALAIEFDGAVKYQRSAVAPSADKQRAIMTDEIRRERRLRALGCDVERLEWGDVLSSSPKLQLRLAKVIAARREAIRSGSAKFSGVAYRPI